MNKKILLIILILCSILMLSACSVSTTRSLDLPPEESATDATHWFFKIFPHKHNYLVVTKNATCNKEGSVEYNCICGSSYTRTLEMVDHNWGAERTLLSPTYFAEGAEFHMCQYCWQIEISNTECLTIPNTGTITVPEAMEITQILKEPQEEDFPDSYTNAVKLYDALMNNTPNNEFCLVFVADTEEERYQKYEDMIAVFEEKCLDNKVHVLGNKRVSGNLIGIEWRAIMLDIQSTYYLPQITAAICHDAGLYTGMSQFEAVKALNEWMRGYFTYEIGYWRINDCIVNRKAQCVGYAELFMAMCKYVGIEAEYVIGCTGHEEEKECTACHAWNRVKLNDTWYYIDICWNDSSLPNRYFLSEELWEGRIIVKKYTREQWI